MVLGETMNFRARKAYIQAFALDTLIVNWQDYLIPQGPNYSPKRRGMLRCSP